MRMLLYLLVLTWKPSPVIGYTATGCASAVKRCQFINDSNIIRTEGVGETIIKNDRIFSQLIRYTPERRHIQTPIEVNEDFLSSLELLYNNDNQLRVLLSLMRSDFPHPWIKLMRGYGSCADYSIIFTCVNDVCQEHDLSKLQYASSIFTEDVIGFELKHNPFSLTVLLAVRNKSTKTNKVITIPASNIGLFNALFNSVKYFFIIHNMRDAPLLRKFTEYFLALDKPYRERPIANLLIRS
ncbi:B115 [miniopterid betaherpesvirus 1]|uniref:Envelope glycoprotein L n=1 Tax=miniopterid betaherpesvirus 1 TaxID=3070189 RepID=I3VQA5_9BETA|nr:B115 [miniopterid betaherpesvirus 1]AFK83949.1 B115 [miniopterid betaherpesvirus 1]